MDLESVNLDDWMKTDQGRGMIAIFSAAVTLAEQQPELNGFEKEKWALSFIYDRLDETYKYPGWVDWLAKDLVIKLAPGLLKMVFDWLKETGVFK